MDDLAWETTDTEIEYRCPGFEIRRDDVRFPDGTADEYHSVEEPPAVVVLPLTPEGDVVAIDEWRQAVGRVNRGLPAGSVEDADGDDLVGAAARELAEETGYEADSFEHLLTIEPTNGVSNAVHHHFVARGCRPIGERNLDDNESIRVTVVEYDELVSAAIDGELRDGRAVTALVYYELISR
ncbi:NUDIX hydrolase [Halorubrum vacuolatum]|uniref:ADP-ribose pyrophosphatase n=1 Tax=Halorubrum vacuolatum TaxID=63740 RepID=A0A238VTJ3_HALVU|nr:NUDIX hydrolase [Halorubrum vacuolatum]SNR37642.1 ADP-ribose pyrophosphatase [Halorubrum vacuolatum]